ncbi:hypothetical protein GJ496_005140 [Pomphorhynchus laevis]|nr:hypothetical protein GJ496_005140 [Pomphorhynchus laevis]
MLSSVDDHDCSNHSNVDVTTYIKSIRETKSLTELIEHVNDLKQDSKILEDKMRECTLTNYSRFLQCVKVLDEINECQNKLCPHISFLRDYLNQLYAGKSMFNHDINLEKILKEKRKYEILIKVKQAAKKIDYLVNRLPDSSETLIKIIKRTDNKIRDLSIDTDHLVVEVQDIWQRSKESLNKILCECDEEKSLHLLNLLFKLGHNAESVKTIFVKTFLYNTWDAVIEKCHHQSQSDIFTEESTFIANELNKLKHKYSILFVDNDHFPEGYRQAEIHILQKFVNHIITEHNCSIPQFNDIVAIEQKYQDTHFI